MLGQPTIKGTLSECSRSVKFENAERGADIILLRTRNGITQEVGTAPSITTSSGFVEIQDPNENFQGRDSVSVYQRKGADKSPPSSPSIEVQWSSASSSSNPPVVSGHLYQCASLIALSMRSGIRVEVHAGSSVIGSGQADSEGIAFITVNSGLPGVGTELFAQQTTCSNPPVPIGTPTFLGKVEPNPVVQPQGRLPAPTIVKGLYECSASVTMDNVLPGAFVFLKGANWWMRAWSTGSTSFPIALPVHLKKDEQFEVRQEIGTSCEVQSEPHIETVGAFQKPDKPALDPIACKTAGFIHAKNLREEATIQIEVTDLNTGTIKSFPAVATHSEDNLPVPSFPDKASVRIRQKECEAEEERFWSEWSEPQTVNTVTRMEQPSIVGDLFHCQKTIEVENISPLAGKLIVKSRKHGSISSNPTWAYKNPMFIEVSPSLEAGDEITVVHDACGFSEGVKSSVKNLADLSAGHIMGQLYDGDTIVTVTDVTSDAHFELRDETALPNTPPLKFGTVPLSPTGRTTLVITGLSLREGQHIYLYVRHCGQETRINPAMKVEFPPVLSRIDPDVAVAGTSSLLLSAIGEHFRNDAKIHWGGQPLITNWITQNKVQATLSATQLSNTTVNPIIVPVQVVVPGGRATIPLPFRINPNPATSTIKAKLTVSIKSGPQSGWGTLSPQITTVTFKVTKLGNQFDLGDVTYFINNATKQLDGSWEAEFNDVPPSNITKRTYQIMVSKVQVDVGGGVMEGTGPKSGGQDAPESADWRVAWMNQHVRFTIDRVGNELVIDAP